MLFYQELRAKHEQIREKVVAFKLQVAEHKKEEGRAVNEMTAPGSGRPKSFAFEHQVRTILASGCSARAAMEQLLSSARVYLSPENFAEYELLVPNKRWSPPLYPCQPPLLSFDCPLPLLHPGFSASAKRLAMKRGSIPC